MSDNMQSQDDHVMRWFRIDEEAGRKIDPDTAEVHWAYRQVLDPHRVLPDLPEEAVEVGRDYFARSPESDKWVWFGDLPEATRDALWEEHKSKLAFPAGLFEVVEPMLGLMRGGADLRLAPAITDPVTAEGPPPISEWGLDWLARTINPDHVRADRRDLEEVVAGYAPKHGYTGVLVTMNVIGACGEVAVCKALGINWDGVPHIVKSADAVTNIHVRTAACKSGHLIVRPPDSNDHRYVLVIGDRPNFLVKGWMQGREAKQKRWRRDLPVEQ